MTRTALIALLTMAGAGLLTGCSSESAPGGNAADEAASKTASSSETPSVKDEAAAHAETDPSAVFPEHLTRGFDHQETVPIPGGGYASAGIICRGHGADVLNVGVKGAVNLADGVHKVVADPLGSPLRFQTGAPDSGIGIGAAQTALDEPEYTLTFEGLDVEITLAGCGPR